MRSTRVKLYRHFCARLFFFFHIYFFPPALIAITVARFQAMRVPQLSSIPVSYPERRDKRRLFTLIVRYPGAALVSNRLSNRVADLQDRKQDRLHAAGSVMPINLQYTVVNTPSRIRR